jgi:enamine deaminase RidA (YjgF/YER057c/UK114 family)
MSEPRRRHFTGVPLEATVGYCRALRVGSRIVVSGTVGLDEQGRPAGDAYGQARTALQRICGAVEALGGAAGDVVRTRMFATHMADFEAITRAHAEVFAGHPPATSFLGISGLAVEGCVVEIEAEAEVDG